MEGVSGAKVRVRPAKGWGRGVSSLGSDPGLPPSCLISGGQTLDIMGTKIHPPPEKTPPALDPTKRKLYTEIITSILEHQLCVGHLMKQ